MIENAVYLCLLTVFQCEMFLLLRVSELLRIKALVTAAGRSFLLWTWRDQLGWKQRLDIFLAIDDRQKLILVLRSAFLSSRSADAHPNMAIGSAVTLHWPRLLSEISQLRAHRATEKQGFWAKCNWGHCVFFITLSMAWRGGAVRKCKCILVCSLPVAVITLVISGRLRLSEGQGQHN